MKAKSHKGVNFLGLTENIYIYGDITNCDAGIVGNLNLFGCQIPQNSLKNILTLQFLYIYPTLMKVQCCVAHQTMVSCRHHQTSSNRNEQCTQGFLLAWTNYPLREGYWLKQIRQRKAKEVSCSPQETLVHDG